MSSSGASSDPRGYDESKPPLTEFHKFGDLPVEMVLLIFDHADPVDRAVLAAASKGMKAIAPDDVFNDVRTNQLDDWEFLLRLDRDAGPRLVLCIDCRLLHPPQICLPSCTDLPRPNYPCRIVRQIGTWNNYITRLAPALYGLAKAGRHGVAPSFVFPEADKEEQVGLTVDIADAVRQADSRTKVNATQHGLFFGRRDVVPLTDWSLHSQIRSWQGIDEMCWWNPCSCRNSMPRLTLKSTEAGVPVGSLFLARQENVADWERSGGQGHPLSAGILGPSMLPGLFEITTSPYPRAPIMGPVVGCNQCSSDLQAEVHFPVNTWPQLVITSWFYIGPADTPNNVWRGLIDITRGLNVQPRIPVGPGQIADMSGMWQAKPVSWIAKLINNLVGG